MPTHCTQDSFDFGRVEGRAVVADFGGGTITSNAGALLLAKADRAVGRDRALRGLFRRRAQPGPDRAHDAHAWSASA